MNREEITRRVPLVAAELLAEKGYIAPVDLLMRLAWLTHEAHESWRFSMGEAESLKEKQVPPAK